ncbi:hypothetical protein ACIP5Y_25700 [Nocardia sp. NPDC088792]|uniref:hypothetical protein n=1 Tax=Nocardia sp. NPDC088792 TaxID=3364332 RepID=UPI0038115C9C
MLSTESTARMQTITQSMGTVHVPPIGLGWLLMPFGDITVLPHSGASPGGVTVLVAVPGHDLVFAAYGNGARDGAVRPNPVVTLA